MGEAEVVADGEPELEGLEEGDATKLPPPLAEGDKEEVPKALKEGLVVLELLASTLLDPVPLSQDPTAEALKDTLVVVVGVTSWEGEGEALREAVPLVQMGSVGTGLKGVHINPPPPPPNPYPTPPGWHTTVLPTLPLAKPMVGGHAKLNDWPARSAGDTKPTNPTPQGALAVKSPHWALDPVPYSKNPTP